MRPTHRIDVQHHILPPDYVRLVGEESIGRLIVSGRMPEWTPQTSIDAMDRNGIEMAVTSLSAPGFHHHGEGVAARIARYCNDYAADLAGRHRGRFAMFATLPMPFIGASLDEIAYALDTLGAAGICLLTNYDGVYLGDAKLQPVLEELNRRGTVVFVHPADAAGDRPLRHIPAATLEFPFDTTRAIVSMLFSGSFTRCRSARFIFSHAGGALPYLADRIARLERRPDFKSHVPDGAMAELDRLYFDTALSASNRVFASLRQLVPMERVLFASDYPFAAEDTMTATIGGLVKLGLAADEFAAIERQNALRLMPNLFNRQPLRGAAE
ncbi:MAG TPA: amidohydrolase family protein [Rhizobiaceae bacterium]|nr:amidohydrolase family protein [Rhizobiaceae bacterium]